VTTFNDEYKALKDLADATPGEIPKYKAIQGMVKHIYAIDTYLNSTYRANKCPLRYLTMSDDLCDEDEPARAKRFVTGRHFAEPNNSLAKEIMARASRSSANAKADNETLFGIIQQSIQHSSYASQADHFKETHDGLSLYKLLKSTQATSSHHEHEAKEALNWSQKTMWVSFQHSGDMNAWIDKLRKQ